MRTFFHSLLYISVGLSSLFCILWILSHFYFFKSTAIAEENLFPPPGISAPAGVPMPPGANPSNNFPPDAPPSSFPPPERNVNNVPPLGANPSNNFPPDAPPSSFPPPERNVNNVPPLGANPSNNFPPDAPPSSFPPPERNVNNIPPPNAPPPNAPPPSSVGPLLDNPAMGEPGVAPFLPPSGKASIDPPVPPLPPPVSQVNTKDSKTGSEFVPKNLQELSSKVVEIHRLLRGYEYDPEDRRNPFVSFVNPEERSRIVQPEQPVIVLTPAEKYELSDMRLIGLKWIPGDGKSTALFQTPDNITHSLQKNDRIGKNRGVIYELREDEVVILEPRINLGEISSDQELYTPIIVRLDRWSNGSFSPAGDSSRIGNFPFPPPGAQRTIRRTR